MDVYAFGAANGQFCDKSSKSVEDLTPEALLKTLIVSYRTPMSAFEGVAAGCSGRSAVEINVPDAST